MSNEFNFYELLQIRTGLLDRIEVVIQFMCFSDDVRLRWLYNRELTELSTLVNKVQILMGLEPIDFRGVEE